jgi:hypothetical protein
MTDTKPTPRTDAFVDKVWDAEKLKHPIREYNDLADFARTLERELAATKSQPVPVEPLSRYDAGLLNDYGGGNVEWWQDYIRAELGRAEEFYEQQFDSLQSALKLAQEERDDAEQMVKNLAPTGRYNGLDIDQWKQRAEKAEADHKAAEQNVSDLMAEVAQTGSLLMKADASNKRLVELLREAQKWLCLQNDFNSQNCAKRIDAELLREVGK